MNKNEKCQKSKGNAKFKEALNLRKLGKNREAVNKLRSLEKKYPNNLKLFLVIADIYWDLKNINKATTYFRKAVSVRPNSEIASLGLFHTLWDKEMKVEALEEMKRYISKYSSMKYNKILKGITEKIDESEA